MGLVAAMGMTDNMMLRGYKKGIPFFTDRRTPKAMAEQLIKELEKQMKKAAADLNFEAAAKLRDKLIELKKTLQEIKI